MTGKKYLRFVVEGKVLCVDLKYLESKDFVLQLGKMDGDKFTPEKEISLEELEKKMGFKIE